MPLGYRTRRREPGVRRRRFSGSDRHDVINVKGGSLPLLQRLAILASLHALTDVAPQAGLSTDRLLQRLREERKTLAQARYSEPLEEPPEEAHSDEESVRYEEIGRRCNRGATDEADEQTMSSETTGPQPGIAGSIAGGPGASPGGFRRGPAFSEATSPSNHSASPVLLPTPEVQPCPPSTSGPRAHTPFRHIPRGGYLTTHQPPGSQYSRETSPFADGCSVVSAIRPGRCPSHEGSPTYQVTNVFRSRAHERSDWKVFTRICVTVRGTCERPASYTVTWHMNGRHLTDTAHGFASRPYVLRRSAASLPSLGRCLSAGND
jgi:hypothetical protein